MQRDGNNIQITLRDMVICYDDYGNSDIPVIFIHGFPFDKSSWQPQVDELKAYRRVIAYDLRGFGGTNAGIEKPGINGFADDLIGFMDALEIPKAIVCGLSMGGYILLNAQHRYPERFAALILSDTQCIADSTEAKEKRYKSIKEIEANGTTGFADGFVNGAFCKNTLENKKELVEKIKNIILSTSPETITATLNALAERWESCGTLARITVPTLILCGREDTVTPPPRSQYMADNIKNSQLHLIENAGHLSNLENENEFNKYLRDFVRNVK